MSQERNDVDDSLGLFEAAMRGSKVGLIRPDIMKVLVLRDGSDQDDTADAFGAAMAKRLTASVESRDIEPDKGDAGGNVEKIRVAAEDADLVVLPAPFGEDIATLKTNSLSSVVDLCLVGLRKPMLLVRHPVEDPEACISRPIGLLEWYQDLQMMVASWGSTLATGGGELALLAGYDPDLLNEVRAVFDDHPEDLERFESMLKRAETRLAGGLVSAVQDLAGNENFNLDYRSLGGVDPADVTLQRANEEMRLSIAGYRSGEGGSGLGRVRNLALGARPPVLALPS